MGNQNRNLVLLDWSRSVWLISLLIVSSFSNFPAVGGSQPQRPTGQQQLQPAFVFNPQQQRPQQQASFPQQFQQPQPRPATLPQAQPQQFPQPQGVPQPASEESESEGAYVHDPSGDATISRFELFKQRKAAEAAQGKWNV